MSGNSFIPWMAMVLAFMLGWNVKPETPNVIPKAECDAMVNRLRDEWEIHCEGREQSAHASGLAVCEREKD